MFLSDQLEEIISKSGHFDLETCNGIIHAIADKLSEELSAFDKIAKQKGSIKSNVIYSAIERQRNTFNQFCKKHPEVPQALIDKVECNLENCRSLVDEAVSRNTKTNTP
jgi:hypothetical protein